MTAHARADVNLYAPVGTAHRASELEARDAYYAGVGVIVTESDRGAEISFGRLTTVNTSAGWERIGGWGALLDTVRVWRASLPGQTFYVVDA